MDITNNEDSQTPPEEMMKKEGLHTGSLSEVISAFGYPPDASCQPLGNGLINKTFLVKATGQRPLLLQQVNTTVFSHPLNIQLNYSAMESYLKPRNYFVPALIKTVNGELLWQSNQKEVWRAFEYMANTFSPTIVSSERQVESVAACFGKFAAVMKDFPASDLKIILPGFHDLPWRYRQLEEALTTTALTIEGELKQLLESLQKRQPLLSLFERFRDRHHFPLHVMHHDCKISNILFQHKTETVICPVDMDTVMPGLFFSDLGDMVRTMCCTADENNTNWPTIAIKESYYDSVLTAYRSATDGLFTAAEKDHLHFSGLLLIYMQALRFLTDHLNGNVYYKVDYPEQNFHRAKNQALLLQSLENLLKRKSISLPY